MSLLKIKPFSIDTVDTFTFGNANVIGNLVSGNASLGNLATANFFQGNGSLLTSLTGANVTGQVANALLAGTVYTNAQPNITSVGTLTGVTANGVINFTGASNVSLGNVANLKITGGTNGYFLQTDGSGGLTWSSTSSATGNANIAGSNTQVFFNDNGSGTLGTKSTFTFDKGTDVLTVSKISANGALLTNIVGANVDGNVAYAITSNYANIANSVSGTNVSGNVASAVQAHYANIANSITFANVSGKPTTISGYGITDAYSNTNAGAYLSSYTGNLTVGNINVAYTTTSTANLGNVALANYFVGNGSLLTGVSATTATKTVNGTSNVDIATASGNITMAVNGTSNVVIVTSTGVNVAGYINAGSGAITTTGNVTGSYVLGNGSQLTSLTGSAVVGNVTNAVQAHYANIANSVSGTNVSGNVTSAVQAHYANIANSVAGANVSGQVANANVAYYESVTTQTSGTFYPVFVNGSTTGNYALASNSALSFNAATGVLTTGTIQSGGGTGGNITGANLISANYFQGNGSLLTSITGANVSGNVTYAITSNWANVANSVSGTNVSGNVTSAVQSHYANIANSVAGTNVSGQVGNALIAGTVYTNAQPNITSVGTLTDLSVSGNTTIAGNLTVSGAFEYANVTSFRVKDPIIEQGGNTAGGALTSSDGFDRGQLLHYYAGGSAKDAFMGFTSSAGTAGEFIFASTATESTGVVSVSAYGNVRASYYFGNGSQLTGVTATSAFNTANGTSNVNIPTASGNITMGVGGTSNVVIVTTSGVNVAGTINATGNITGSYVFGNGSQLTSLTGSAVVGNVTSAVQSHYANIANSITFANVSGTPTTISGYGITDAYSNTNTAAYLATATFTTTGNITAGNINAGNLLTANYSTAVLTTAAQPNITSVGTLTSLAVTGNVSSGNASLGNLVTANYFKGDGSQLTNINASNITGAYGNSNVAAYLPTYTGNVSANYFIGNGSTLTNITGGNVTGQVGNALIAGTVYTNAQPNITSVGTLSSLAVSGTTNLGAVGNVTITGGSADYFLKTNGSGVLSFASVPSTTLTVDTFTGDGSWTMKNLSVTPISSAYTIVAIGGVSQPRTSYSVSTNVITFSDPPPNGAIVEITTVIGGSAGAGGGGASVLDDLTDVTITSPSTNQVLKYNGTAWVNGTGGASWTYSAVSANTTAVAGYRYIVDTSTANITITLPASATLGDEVMIIDGTGNASSHQITVDKNGHSKIAGSASNMTVPTDRAAFTLVYYNSTQGWLLTNV
jgi:hypothetical protein